MNAIIIGSGPAGISASLYTARAGIDTTVISKGSGSLKKAEKIENYYGFAAPVAGTDLEAAGIENAKRIGVKFVSDEVVGLVFEDKFVVKTSKSEYKADGVIIATGSSRNAPKIPGIAEYEGRGVSYCATCDAFFYRGKDTAVLGSGEYAVHEAIELLPVAHSVTLLTNGENITVGIPDGIAVKTGKIKAVTGSGRVGGVMFEDGEELAVAGIFIALGVAGSVDLARKIGAPTAGNKIIVDEKMATAVPGLYAAGDCTGGMYQVAKAVYEGAVAGTELVKYLRKK